MSDVVTVIVEDERDSRFSILQEEKTAETQGLSAVIFIHTGKVGLLILWAHPVPLFGMGP